MSWQQAVFVVDAAQVEPLSTMLEAFFAQAITTENAGEDEFYEVAFPGTPDWEKVQLTALFDEAIDLDPIVEFVQSQFGGKSEVPAQIQKLVDQDWERVWLQSFKPIQVGNDLWVCPSWCEPSDPSSRNIVLDPGLAFGTGTHPTTHLCLDWIADQDLSGQAVLDYGAGSGLLAIAALFAGANYADAVDIDPLAVAASKENALRNKVNGRLMSCLPDELDENPKHRYQLVIANILAEVIHHLHPTLLGHLDDKGTILLTGILSDQKDAIIERYSDIAEFEVRQQDHWCMLVGRRSF